MRLWRRRIVNRRRTAREDQALWRSRIYRFDGRVEGKDFAVHARFSYSTSDELCVLRSEVKYYYGLMIYAGHGLERRLIILSYHENSKL